MTSSSPVSPEFRLTSSGVQARAELSGNQLIVKAGSTARQASAPSFGAHSYAPLREALVTEGKLVAGQDPAFMVYAQDVPFSSASAAAAVTLGRAANGKTEWYAVQEGGRRVPLGDWALSGAGSVGGVLVAEEPDALQTSWPPFFHAMGIRLLEFQDRQEELLQVLTAAGVNVGLDEQTPLTVIDPFSFVSLILKHHNDAHVAEILTVVAERLQITEQVPTELTGIPWSNPLNAWFFGTRNVRRPEDLPLLWELAGQAVSGTLKGGTFEQALTIHRVGLAKLTQGLFWLNPGAFLALDRSNVQYLKARGMSSMGKATTLPGYLNVLSTARKLAPDFVTLSHAAWLAASDGVVDLIDGRFPYQEFQADVTRFDTERVKGNLVLDRKYAPLLLDLLEDNGFEHLTPSRSPYSGREQLALKIGLGQGAKLEAEGAFGRALLFAGQGGFESLPFPPGLTLEVGLPDGHGDQAREALRSPDVRERLVQALLNGRALPEPATLTLNSDFEAAKLLLVPESEADIRTTVDTYAEGFGKSRRLRVGVTLSPADLEGAAFLEHLQAALVYLDELTGVLGGLSAASPVSDPWVPTGPLNQILYGPPGTGKTYAVVDKALAVLDPAFLAGHSGDAARGARKKRYDELDTEGRITFVTFHQSFNYEDFIEGIKPEVREGAITYDVTDGVFLTAVQAAGGELAVLGRAADQLPEMTIQPDVNLRGRVWKLAIDDHAGYNQMRERLVARNEIRIGIHTGRNWSEPSRSKTEAWAREGVSQPSTRMLVRFNEALRVGDLVLLAGGAEVVLAVGVVTGDARHDPSDPVFTSEYGRVRSVRWLAHRPALSAAQLTGQPFAPSSLELASDVSPARVLDALTSSPASSQEPAGLTFRPHVLIIDEINRGNVAKIFGELITLLEPSKRQGADEALTATLPLSRRKLSVPSSLYIIGTMNTADRSLTQLDAALRRRFVFQPVWPRPEVLPVLDLGGTALDLRKFLAAINDRIERLYDREHVIGHAYLLDLPETLAGVAQALRERILPLLEEYFFDDWAKIREVLGDPGKPREQQFVHERQDGEGLRYALNPLAFTDVEAFTLVYSRLSDSSFSFGS